MNNSFLNEDELSLMGFKRIGKSVKISRFANFYGIQNIEIGDYSRIDDFCILSGKIKIGRYCHLSAYNALYGAQGIEIHDYAGLSPRCSVFSAMDDFSGEFMIGPELPKKYTNVQGGKVIISNYCQIGAGCVIFPSITIGEGSVVGSLSLINKNIDAWGIYMGVPAKFFKARSKKLLDLGFNM